jgi:hypothetical protein
MWNEGDQVETEQLGLKDSKMGSSILKEILKLMNEGVSGDLPNAIAEDLKELQCMVEGMETSETE